jgi:signal transduction histidine kinase
MNLKLRFALLFTFFVAIILLLTSSTVYFLFQNDRTDAYLNRAEQEAETLYKEYKQLDSLNHDIKGLEALHNNIFQKENLFIIDSSFNIIYKEPDSLNYVADKSFLAEVKKEKKKRFADNMVKGVGIYENGMYVIIASEDVNEAKRLSRYKLIIALVFLGGIILTAFASFLFVRQGLRPLVRLSLQMQQTSEQNLSERVDEGKGKDEITQIAKNFNAMLERLKLAFESQKSFVHHASHELRTPLASMLSQTESALNKNLSPEGYQKVLQSLQEDQNGLIELTNSLLLLSQYEKMYFSKQWPWVRIDEVMYDAIISCKKMLGGINVSFSFDNVPQSDKYISIKGNDALLKVAFINLIKNAYQYSADKKVTISIGNDEEEIHLHFNNHGRQLSPQEIEQLMVPFFRGSNSANVKGFGLGLSIVQRIISLHNGKLEYKPVQHDVNCFAITFSISQ